MGDPMEKDQTLKETAEDIFNEIRKSQQENVLCTTSEEIYRALKSLQLEKPEKYGHLSYKAEELQISRRLPKTPDIRMKLFNDPVHGHISIHPLCRAIIDTPQFQRLRYLKQLGTCYFVNPGAAHNRFEHSIGVCYLAGKFARILQRNQPELNINETDVLCVEIAGLCRGLGNGPYSHVFEDSFMPETSKNKSWNLKHTSRKMLEHLLEKNIEVAELFKAYDLGDPNDKKNIEIIFIKEMIFAEEKDDAGKPIYKGRGVEKTFLYEIITGNEKTGIAVHTFDFLARDCHHLGFHNVFDHFRYMKFARVIPVDGINKICIRDKEITNLYNLYFTKYTLTKYAYRHKVNIAVQLMLAEIMQRANKHLLFPTSETGRKRCTIEECVEDMEAFTELDDNILHMILHFKIPDNDQDEEKKKDMEEAEKLVRKILSRDLYYCVCESQPLDKDKLESVDEITKQIINQGKDFTGKDIIVKKISFDVGSYKKDPLKSIIVYAKKEINTPTKMNTQENSRILRLVECAEEFVRVYIRERNKDLEKNVYEAFEKWKQARKDNAKKNQGRTDKNTTNDGAKKTESSKEHGSMQLMKSVESVVSIIDKKIFNDPVHGHIEINAACLKIIDTPEFQRLRNISQLGMVYFVFPGAAHNRFEHSLGLCHLAGTYARVLRQNNPHIQIEDKDILCLEIAGLCYNIGHGPLSRMFTEMFLPLFEQNKRHRKKSSAMFQHLLDKNNIDLREFKLTAEDIIFIKEIIDTIETTGSMEWPYKGRTESQAFLYEIVVNRRNGIDAYKWDYMARDCHHLGIKNNFDPYRYMKFARVIEHDFELQICMREKESLNLYNMFHTRYVLQKFAYQHQVTCCLNVMVIQALKLANKYITFKGKNEEMYKISECHHDMEAFSQLTDHVLFRIKYFKIEDSEKDTDKCRDMKKAKRILDDIFNRKLFQCVYESCPSTPKITKQSKDKQEKQDSRKMCKEIVEAIKKKLQNNSNPDSQDDQNEDFYAEISYIDFGMREENPVNRLNVYTKENPDKAKALTTEETTKIFEPTFYDEVIVRVFTERKRSPEVINIIKTVVNGIIEKYKTEVESQNIDKTENPDK